MCKPRNRPGLSHSAASSLGRELFVQCPGAPVSPHGPGWHDCCRGSFLVFELHTAGLRRLPACEGLSPPTPLLGLAISALRQMGSAFVKVNPREGACSGCPRGLLKQSPYYGAQASFQNEVPLLQRGLRTTTWGGGTRRNSAAASAEQADHRPLRLPFPEVQPWLSCPHGALALARSSVSPDRFRTARPPQSHPPGLSINPEPALGPFCSTDLVPCVSRLLLPPGLLLLVLPHPET